MIDGRNFFDQPINSMTKTYENIRKIATGQGDDYTTGCLLDYSYFKENYKMIAIDLGKQQALEIDPRAIQQINFIANLDRDGNTTTFFIIEEAKETVEIEEIIKIVKSLEDSGLLLKGVTETVQNEVKEKKEDFLVCY